jgi:1,4-dihydroxy-2-naphthoate octaprenyltransferase
LNLPPWLILLLLVALAIALIYQLASRRYGWRVLGYWIFVSVGVLGFEALAESMGLNLTRMGDVRLGPDVLGGALAAAVLWVLRI